MLRASLPADHMDNGAAAQSTLLIHQIWPSDHNLEAQYLRGATGLYLKKNSWPSVGCSLWHIPVFWQFPCSLGLFLVLAFCSLSFCVPVVSVLVWVRSLLKVILSCFLSHLSSYINFPFCLSFKFFHFIFLWSSLLQRIYFTFKLFPFFSLFVSWSYYYYFVYFKHLYTTCPW